MFCDHICSCNAGLTIHRQRKHLDTLVAFPPVPAPALANACAHCDMSFSTEVGLTQHKRHPLEYNADNVDHTKPSTRRRNINTSCLWKAMMQMHQCPSVRMKLFRTCSMPLVIHHIRKDHSLRPLIVSSHKLDKHDAIITNCSDYVKPFYLGRPPISMLRQY